MLSHGIDALLDMPVVEFETQNLSGDGKVHQLGIEYLPTHWRDQVAVTLPQWSFFRLRRLWIGAGVGALLLICVVAYFRRRPQPHAAPVSSPVVQPAPPAAQPAKSATRPPTVAETVMDPRKVPSQRIPTAVEQPVAQPSLAASAAAAPVLPAQPSPRAATILAASQPDGLASFLAGTSGPYAGQRFSVSAQEFWIGSSANNHLCLNADPGVSGNHACIRREDRFVRIYDNGSLNNTIVNGRPIGKEVVLLRVGDRVRFGQSEFVLEA
jgi:hypothetical protein